uniref:Uncharacterized protein n=1 Tax=Chromera velia CCMP2878 TaxID=1169474 RepID=A0A0G4IEN8_9ALVE|eukprot:Cvel_13749.t1-p1 / transcript=Cvel_13749.t1 / gene=Cvel_13749 / organism=Chromera_velia_CCMP2878 / gene_product=hypothetical protein / transcript_product=hypothetical protein / location=Cvel_scaffold951:59534-61501(+) / protein_length=301 / sequence_SO=supercontig / SO=protein_coding / is_pseudo=false
MALLPIDLLAEVVNKQFETQTETNEDQTEGSQTVVDTVADTEADQKAAANKEKEVHVRFAGDDPVPPPPEQGDEWGIHEQLDAICNKSLDPGIDGLARVLTAREWQRSCKETPASLLMEKMEQIDRQVARRKKEKARAFFNLQQQHSRTANWFSDPDPPQTEGRGDQRDPDQDALLKLFAWKVAENIGRRAFDLRPVRTGSKHEGIEHEKKVAVKNAESTMETEGGGDILSLCEALQDASASLEMLSVDDARREQMVDTFKRLVKEMDRQKSEMLHSLQDSAKQDDEYIRSQSGGRGREGM